jgi:stearoyl-CoA desaturase (delta-9 desaturase)
MQDTPTVAAGLSGEEEKSVPAQYFSLLHVSFFLIVHLGALVSFAYFSWTNLAVMFVLYVVTGLGITVGYHRLLAHRSFRTPLWLERTIATVGAIAMQGGPAMWVADHRQHHFHSDDEGDPHDIHRGFLFAHMGWLCHSYPEEYDRQRFARYARDILSDPYYRWLDRYHAVPGLAVGAILYLLGGLPLFLWGFCTRVVLLYHSTWLVNSAAHCWGYRRFQEAPGTNNWVVALLAFGEGWHNNHHAWPGSARHGLRPREVDVSWLVISALRKLGLVRDVAEFRFDGPRGNDGRLIRS